MDLEQKPFRCYHSVKCGPGRIRTYDRSIRSAKLYPAELQGHCVWVVRFERTNVTLPKRAGSAICPSTQIF